MRNTLSNSLRCLLAFRLDPPGHDDPGERDELPVAREAEIGRVSIHRLPILSLPLEVVDSTSGPITVP